MNHLKALGILGLAAALTLSIGPRVASATKIGGLAARAASDADTSCANYAYGALTNDCSTTKSFLVPLMFETAGYKALAYRAKGATSSNNVGCKGVSATDTGGFYMTPTVYLSQFGSIQDVTIGDLYINGTQTAYINCSIDNGGKLSLVEWEQ
ncbi:MAG: hypothetical protein IT372_19655 [Polyangiaceae bacterium]|nr:hypothetical protein [Polyangiaceae bacterium]